MNSAPILDLIAGAGFVSVFILQQISATLRQHCTACTLQAVCSLRHCDCTLAITLLRRQSIITFRILYYIIIIITITEGNNARQAESDRHQINPKAPALQYQPIEGKKRKRKILGDKNEANHLGQ